MRFEPGRTTDDLYAELRAEAERTWGPDRLAALAPTLEGLAAALARLADGPLEPLEAEPDFIGGAARWPGGAHP